jgi:chromosomal replication initiator protein
MITIDLITDVVCDHFGVNKSFILSDNQTPGTRKAEYIQARHYAMYICRVFKTGSQTEIGKYFLRDHSSVIHAEKVVSGEISVYLSKKKQLERLIEKVHIEEANCEECDMLVYPDYINN